MTALNKEISARLDRNNANEQLHALGNVMGPEDQTYMVPKKLETESTKQQK